MEPDWEKIKDKPEKDYKVSGQFLLDQKQRLLILQDELNKIKSQNSELNNNLNNANTEIIKLKDAMEQQQKLIKKS